MAMTSGDEAPAPEAQTPLSQASGRVDVHADAAGGRGGRLRRLLFSDLNRDLASAMNYASIDRFTRGMVWTTLGFLALVAVLNSVFALGDRWPSPLAWRAVSVPAAGMVVGIGALSASAALHFHGRLRNHYAWRVLATSTLLVHSFLLIYLSGGAIEAHFHLFMVMAYVAIYADWRLEWLVVGMVSLHHVLFEWVEPEWVYVYGFNGLAPVVHASSVVATAIFLTFLCASHRDAVSRMENVSSALARDIDSRERALRERDEARRELAEREKLATVGTLASGVAHEVRTPLTYVSNRIHLARWNLSRAQEEGRPPDPEVAGHLEDALQGVDRINRLVTNMRRHVGHKSGQRTRARLADLVREATSLFEATHRGRALVETDLEGSRAFLVDRVQIQQVVLNLLENAVEAMPWGGTVRITTRDRATGGGEIVIADDGPGIPPEVQDRMYDPFYTTKDDGTGLGLSIIRRIVQDHGGTIRCVSQPGRGTTFLVWFPPDDEADTVGA